MEIISIKLPCVFVCLSSRDLFLVRVSSLFSYFLCYKYFSTIPRQTNASQFNLRRVQMDLQDSHYPGGF